MLDALSVEKTGSQQITKRCSFIEYPNHPLPSRRGPCHGSLLKTVELKVSGRTILYPHKIYCYKSLQSSLQELLLRPEFCKDCEHWRACASYYKEVYDGLMWKKFQHVDGSSFLRSPFSC